MRKKFETEFRPVFMTFTTGRSTEPVPFLYTRHDLSRLAIAGKRVMEICGAHYEDRMLNSFPYAPHLAFWLTHYAGTSFGAMMFSSGGGKVMSTLTTLLRLIRKIQAGCFHWHSHFPMYHVLHQAAEEGLRWENFALPCARWRKRSVTGCAKNPRDVACELGAGGD